VPRHQMLNPNGQRWWGQRPSAHPRLELMRLGVELRREALRDQDQMLESIIAWLTNIELGNGLLEDGNGLDPPHIEQGPPRPTARQLLQAIFAAVPASQLTEEGYPTLRDVNDHLEERGFDPIDRATLRREYQRWGRGS
jgi:hypothetical protein